MGDVRARKDLAVDLLSLFHRYGGYHPELYDTLLTIFLDRIPCTKKE
jgi:hypothetical protein